MQQDREKIIVTLRELADRADYLLKDSPGRADQQVYLSIRKSRRITEYIPIRWVGGGTTLVGGVRMTEARGDEDNIITFDSARGVKPRKGADDAK